MSKQIISEIADRQAFLTLLQHNTGLIVIKLGAEWCGPCKKIDPYVYEWMGQMPPNIKCAILDIDDNFEVYAFLKSKKMVNGIPVLLCYKKGNTTFIPDDMITGADPTELHKFFKNSTNF